MSSTHLARPLRPCLASGCPERVAHGYCKTHSPQRADHGQAHRKLLSSYRWRKTARAWLDAHPFCGQRLDGRRHPEHSACTRDRRLVLATCVDHIIPVSKGGAHWSEANHQSLCRACNSAKGDATIGTAGRLAGDDDGTPRWTIA